MDTGNSISSFDIANVSEGCNYSDDILAVTAKQSPNSMNVEFFNGRIRKRPGELSFTTTPTGQGGIDSFTKLMLHADGTNASTTFTDSEITPKTVTTVGSAALSTTTSKFGTASGKFLGDGIDTYTTLALHMDGANGSTTFTDSETTPKTVSAVATAQISTAASKFGGASGLFNGTTDYLTIPNSADFNFGSADFTVDFWVYFPTLPATGGFFKTAADGNATGFALTYNSGIGLRILINGQTACNDQPWTPTINTWYHIAYVRYNGIHTTYVNGIALGSTTDATAITDSSDLAVIGLGCSFSTGVWVGSSSFYLSGYMDELRVSKGIARWTSNFTPPILAYASVGTLTLVDSTDWNFAGNDFTIDFWVSFVSTPNGCAGLMHQGDDATANGWSFTLNGNFLNFYINASTAVLSSAWTPSLSTWYHLAVVRHSTAWVLYINGTSVATATSSTSITDSANTLVIAQGNSYSTGVWVGSSLFYLNGYLDEVRISNTARWTANFSVATAAYDTYNASVPPVGYSIIDFSDTNAHHKQVSHLGPTVYAYDQVSNTKITLRSAAPSTRSFNAKVGSYLIQTYNDYSAPYYWDGAAASMATISNNAPGFKRSIEFQGYMLGMNISGNKMRCYYQLLSNLLGGGAAYSDYFTLTPAPNDDEISDPFILNGRCYVGTKYGIFRISFVGGVTIFEFKQVVSTTGIVPNTAQVVVTRDFGQIVLFMGTDKRLYLFDGANIKTVSDLFYYRNRETAISLELVDDNYKENSFSVYDSNRRMYRLFVTKNSYSMNNYCINVDIETFAYYPFDNMHYAAGCMCYDALLRAYLVCVDYQGILHKMFIQNNTDNGTAINEYYDSPILSQRNNAIKEAQTLTLNCYPTSNAKLLVYEKIDFRNTWQIKASVLMASVRDKFLGKSFVLGSALLGSEKSVLNQQIGTSSSFNFYQIRLLSDTPTAQPWEIIDISFDESMLKIGKGEALR